MNANTVPYLHTTGPNYFTESFAVFNELLVLDQLAQHAKTPSERRFYERAYVDRMTQCFQAGYEALFEHLLYTRASPPQNAEGFESLMQETGAQFSTWYGPGSDRQMEWIQPVQFFTRPLYRINYVYANLLALAYMGALKRDAVDFAPKYMRLLSQGYYNTPERLLSENRRHQSRPGLSLR